MLKLVSGLLLLVASQAIAAIKEEPVTYKDGDTTLHGFIVYDDAVKGKRPGIVVVHEWWGITAHTRSEARKFAEQGYTAFVADMFAGKTADNPTDAGGLSKGLMGNPAGMQARFNAAYATLAKHATVDAKHIGASGYCMGGSVVLNMARTGADLASVVAFHAGLGTSTPATEGKVKAKVLVLNGADDPFVKPTRSRRSRKRWKRRRSTTSSSTTRARCMRTPTRRPPPRASSSSCRSPTTRKWTSRRKARRRNSSPAR